MRVHTEIAPLAGRGQVAAADVDRAQFGVVAEADRVVLWAALRVDRSQAAQALTVQIVDLSVGQGRHGLSVTRPDDIVNQTADVFSRTLCSQHDRTAAASCA